MLAQLIGAGLGAGFNAFNAYEQAKKQKELLRIEEDYNRMGNAEIERAKERNALLNPQATAQRARQDVAATQSAAVGQALNAAAGQSASSGDFGNTQAAAIQGSQAAQAAAAPYAQQNAAIAQQAQEAEQNRIRQSESLGQTQANLSQNVTYLEREKNNINPLASALQVGFGSLVGGANVASSLLGLANDKDVDAGRSTGANTSNFVMQNKQNEAPPPPTTQPDAPFFDLTQNNPQVNLFSNQIKQPMVSPMQPAAPAAPAAPPMPATNPNFMTSPYNMAMTMQQGFAPLQRFMKPKRNF